VFAPNHILIALQGDSAVACIDSLRIVSKDVRADAPAIWEIEQITPIYPTDTGSGGVVVTEQRSDCVKAVTFPHIPLGYELVSRSPVTALPPGSYWITGRAHQYWLSGDFQVPVR